MTDCPMLSFFTAAHSTQKPVQVMIATYHRMDVLMPYGQAYRTKSSSLRILDPRFGPTGHHYSLSSLAGWQNHCCQAEEVDSAHWAAREVNGQKKYCHLHGLNANGFQVTAVGQLGIQEMNFEISTIVQSGCCHDIPRFDTYDEVM